jgi:hypothetical protein
MQDRSHRGVGFTVGDTPHAQQARLAFDQGHDADRPLADDGVAFPVADTLAAVDDRRALRDAAPSEALTLARRAAAVSSPSLAASKMLPQGATAIAQQHLRSLLGYCNSPQMNSPEAYIQFKPDMITADGDVTIKDTEDFLRTYMQELHAFIVRVMTVHPREQ